MELLPKHGLGNLVLPSALLHTYRTLLWLLLSGEQQLQGALGLLSAGHELLSPAPGTNLQGFSLQCHSLQSCARMARFHGA